MTGEPILSQFTLDESMRFALNLGIGSLFAFIVIIGLLAALRVLIGSQVKAIAEIPSQIQKEVRHFDTELATISQSQSANTDRIVDKLEVLAQRQELALDKLAEATTAQTVQNAQTGKALEILLQFISQNMVEITKHRVTTESNPPPVGVIVPVQRAQPEEGSA
jgi:cytoskeletal protein RodZ